MSTRRVLTTGLALGLVPAMAAAQAVGPVAENVRADEETAPAAPRWSYLEGQWLADGEFKAPGDDIDSDGLGLEVSLAASEIVFFQSAYEANNLELAGADIAYDRFRIGPGLTTDLALGRTVLAPWLRLDYRRDSLAGQVFDGYGAALGLRWRIGRFEAQVSGAYAELDRDLDVAPGEADLEESTVELALRYALTPRWWLTAAYRSGQIEDDDGAVAAPGDEIDFDRVLLGLRWAYAAAPPELVDQEDPAPADPFNYVDLLYIFGDELETQATGASLDIERGALIRASAALSNWLIVAAGAQTLHLDSSDADDISLDWVSIGPGLRHGFAGAWGELDVYGAVTYERASFIGGAVFDGPGAAFGLRYRIGNLELAPAAKVFATETDAAGDPELDGEVYSLDLIYSVSPAVGLIAHAAWTDAELSGAGPDIDLEQTVFGAGLRFYFGG